MTPTGTRNPRTKRRRLHRPRLRLLPGEDAGGSLRDAVIESCAIARVEARVSALQGFLERLAGLECRGSGRRNVERFPRVGVPSRPGLATACFERAEAADGD